MIGPTTERSLPHVLLFTMEAKTMSVDLVQFTENVDSWVKQIRTEVSQLTDVSEAVEENTDNVQHNYELIYELKQQMEKLAEEVKALKLIQLLQLKEKVVKKAQ